MPDTILEAEEKTKVSVVLGAYILLGEIVNKQDKQIKQVVC